MKHPLHKALLLCDPPNYPKSNNAFMMKKLRGLFSYISLQCRILSEDIFSGKMGNVSISMQ